MITEAGKKRKGARNGKGKEKKGMRSGQGEEEEEEEEEAMAYDDDFPCLLWA